MKAENEKYEWHGFLEEALLTKVKAKCDLDTLAFTTDIKELVFYSDRKGNDDERGGGCGRAGFTKDDFVWTSTNPNGLTVRDVVEAVYRLKGSKYDLYYELFSGIELLPDGRMRVNFNYGS